MYSKYVLRTAFEQDEAWTMFIFILFYMVALLKQPDQPHEIILL